MRRATSADLDGANLTGADLTGAELEDAFLSDMNLLLAQERSARLRQRRDTFGN